MSKCPRPTSPSLTLVTYSILLLQMGKPTWTRAFVHANASPRKQAATDVLQKITCLKKGKTVTNHFTLASVVHSRCTKKGQIVCCRWSKVLLAHASRKRHRSPGPLEWFTAPTMLISHASALRPNCISNLHKWLHHLLRRQLATFRVLQTAKKKLFVVLHCNCTF